MNQKSAALACFRAIPRMSLANLPTAVEALDRLAARLGGPRLFVKRDDALGYLVGGNKLRKLEYVMAEVVRCGATAVVTTGSLHSNHARITALVARRLGLRCALVLNGDPAHATSGNFQVTRRLGVECHFVGERAERCAAMARVAEALTEAGERVYQIPLGCSNAEGSFGLVAAAEELREQMRRQALRVDALVVASSSGGTQAGLEVGKRLFGLDGLEIIGVSADDPAGAIGETVAGVAASMLERLGLPALGAADVRVDDRFVGPGYGQPTEESEEATRLFAETEGILLDPFYTAKAAAALIAYCREGHFGRDAGVLFWHTGGLLNLF